MTQEAQPFFMFVQGFVFQAITYFGIVGLLFLVFWKWGEKRFRGCRIQAKKRTDAKQIAFEVKNTLWVMLTGSPLTLVI
jgi:hypothetical protein